MGQIQNSNLLPYRTRFEINRKISRQQGAKPMIYRTCKHSIDLTSCLGSQKRMVLKYYVSLIFQETKLPLDNTILSPVVKNLLIVFGTPNTCPRYTETWDIFKCHLGSFIVVYIL